MIPSNKCFIFYHYEHMLSYSFTKWRSPRSSKSCTGGYPRGSRNKQLFKMLLRYLLVIPVQLRPWPCKRPPITQPRRPEMQTRMRFRNAEVSLLLFRSAQRALHKASAPPNTARGSQISLPACTKVVLTTVTESRISCRVAQARCVDFLQTRIGVAGCRVHPPLLGRYFGLFFGMCCQP